MKKQTPPANESAAEQHKAARKPKDTKGRSGEGAHSAMKHWLQEEQKRTERPDRRTSGH